jgi:hypothetical protein
VVSFTTLPLYLQGKSPFCTLDRRLGGLQNRSGRGGEKNRLRVCEKKVLRADFETNNKDVTGSWKNCILIKVKVKGKCQQHVVFPSGHPSKYLIVF